MEIKVWKNFKKRRNSTKQPNMNEAITINAVLKNGTSVEQPTFQFQGNDFDINYVYAFGHYYFKNDIVSMGNNLIELSCVKDALATHKSEVVGYNGFVEYTTSSDNVTITDSRNVPTWEHSEAKTIMNVSVPVSETGFYLVGLINKETSVAGGVTFYACDSSNFAKLKNEMASTDFWEQVYQRFVPLNECIVSCTWIPLNLNALIDSGCFGSYTILTVLNEQLTDAWGYKLTRRYVNVTPSSYAINFPLNYGFDYSYINTAPYSTGTLFLPFVGVVSLDLDALAQSQSIRIGTHIDIPTGDIIYEISFGDSGIISTYAGNIATKVPMSSSSFDSVGIAGGILGTIGGAVGGAIAGGLSSGTAGAIVGGIGGFAGGVGAITKSCEIHSMTNGSISSGLGVFVGNTYSTTSSGNAIATIITRKPSEENLLSFKNELGMPYFKNARLGSLAGFIKCYSASLTLDHDQDEVNAFLNNGFYLE